MDPNGDPIETTGAPLISTNYDSSSATDVNLVEGGVLTAEELDAFHAEWRDAAEDPSAVFTAPPVLATVARKPFRL